MTLLQSFLLGLLQGITEFLPISSSGHLILVEEFFGLKVAELKTFDVALHAGTLIAIIIYFRKDFYELIRAFLSFFKKNPASVETRHGVSLREYRKLIGYLIIGTLPAVIAGGLLSGYIDANFRTADQVATHMLFAGTFFLISEYIYSKKLQKIKTSAPSASSASFLTIGLFQAIALFPGFSRSGMTISSGIIQGLKREQAARFSFLLGAIAIFGAIVLTALKMIKHGPGVMPVLPTIVGFLTSLVAGYFSVAFLIKFLKNHTLKIFAGYLLIVGSLVLIVF